MGDRVEILFEYFGEGHRVGGFKLGILLEFCIEYTVSFEI